MKSHMPAGTWDCQLQQEASCDPKNARSCMPCSSQTCWVPLQCNQPPRHNSLEVRRYLLADGCGNAEEILAGVDAAPGVARVFGNPAAGSVQVGAGQGMVGSSRCMGSRPFMRQIPPPQAAAPALPPLLARCCPAGWRCSSYMSLIWVICCVRLFASCTNRSLRQETRGRRGSSTLDMMSSPPLPQPHTSSCSPAALRALCPLDAPHLCARVAVA